MFVISICLSIVIFMPLIAKVPLAVMMNRAGGYDNRHPRIQQQSLKGMGARARAAHENCFEAICFFAPTVLLVLAVNATTQTTAYLCIAFVVFRVFYLVCYWLDLHILRSVCWVIAMATIAGHYWLLFAGMV